MASSSASTSSKVATKRKRNTLSIETKLQILKKIEKGSSLSSLAAEYGTGKSTIFDIKRSREKIMKFATEAVDETSLKKRCIVRRADDSTFDKAIHLWFLQERHKGTQKKAFSTCLAWLEQQQESTAMNLLLLSELQSLATKKKFCSLKQRKLCEYSI